jgi:hypothetical protein
MTKYSDDFLNLDDHQKSGLWFSSHNMTLLQYGHFALIGRKVPAMNSLGTNFYIKTVNSDIYTTDCYQDILYRKDKYYY